MGMAGGKCTLGLCVATVIVCGVAMIHPDSAEGQTDIVQAPSRPTAGSQTSFIPSLSLSERYDSNVYFLPGKIYDDYVTSVSPQLRMVHKRSLADVTVGGGFIAEAYAKNPGLNYMGANALMNLDLDRAMSELIRGFGLKISDNFNYTPQLPAFAAPTSGGQLPPALVSGIQAQRANSLSNNALVSASYAVSPRVSVTSGYSDQRIRFKNVITPTPGVPAAPFIDTTFQNVSSGVVVRTSPVDSLNIQYQYQMGSFFSGASSFSTQGGTVGWTRVIMPTLTASINGGVSVFTQANNLQYVGSGSLVWAGKDTDVTLSYAQVVAPSYYIVPTPLLGRTVSAIAAHRVSQAWTLSINGYYALNESVPDTSLLSFKSYAVTPGISYQVNRPIRVSLLFTYSRYESTVSSQAFGFERNMVILNMTGIWE